jgi:hypothetical protein
MAYLCTEPSSKIIGTFVDDGGGHYKGECVSLVKKMSGKMPATSSWKKGNLVKGDSAVVKGTAIATFEGGKKFISGNGHAAIYISQDTGGIWVWDQYNHPPKAVGKRYLPFDDSKGNPNNGNKFYVID